MKKLLLVSAMALTLTACTSDQLVGSLGAAGTAFKGLTLSEDEVKSESLAFVKQSDAQNKIASSKSKYTKRLNKLTQNLKTYDGLTLNYKVYMVDQINAWATPDGSIRVYSGLMDKMDDDQLVAVIGHEIGHVANKHSYNQFRDAYLTAAAKEGAVAAGGTVGDVAASYGDVAEAFLGAQFSQSDELESDAYGVILLKSVNRDPYAAMRAQQTLMAQGGGGGGLFSSHPSSSERIEKARIAADQVTGKK